MILRLTDGTMTVNLMGGPIYRAHYVPAAPKLSTVEYSPGSMADGGEVASVTRPHVVETCDVTAVEDTGDNLQTTLQSLDSLFLGALEWTNRRGGKRLYVEFAAEDDDDVYRSEILYARMQPGKDTLSLWCDASAEVQLTWKRRFYWEGPEEELSLDNVHGSGTGGITIKNHNDAADDNFVEIAAASVEGTLPTPPRIEITNTYDVSARLQDVYMGLNVYSANLQHFLEGEDAVYPSGGGTGDSSCSGGSYKATTTFDTTQTWAMYWTISSTQLGYAGGRWFRLIMRLRTPPSTTTFYVQPKVTFPAGTPLTPVYEADEVKLQAGAYFHDLGVVQIPPWLQGLGAELYPVDLTLFARTNAGSAAMDVDYVQLTPMDCYRILKPRGYGADLNIRIADDGIGGWLWTDGWSGNQKTGHYYGLGLPVHLVPGKYQRLVFLMTSTTGAFEIDRSATVRIYYRPRRETL